MTKKSLKDLGYEIDVMETFLENTFKELESIVPMDIEDRPKFLRLLRVTAVSAGLAYTTERVYDEGPVGLLSVMKSELNLILAAINQVKAERSKEEHDCVGCEKKDNCPIAQYEWVVPPTDENGDKLLH